MIATVEKKILNNQKMGSRLSGSSMGLLFPYQPSMWDDKLIKRNFDRIIELIQLRINNVCSAGRVRLIINRIKKIVEKLNTQTLRQSLAIILTPDDEKVFYLNFPVKPVVLLNDRISILDLLSTQQQDPGFYLLNLQEQHVQVFEYINNQLKIILDHSDNSILINAENIVDLYRKVSEDLFLLNNKTKKPAFLAGNPGLIKVFYSSVTFPEIVFKLPQTNATNLFTNMYLLYTEIICHWESWKSKSMLGRIILAQKINSLVSRTETVLQALYKVADGELIIDKQLIKQMNKLEPGNKLFFLTDDLNNQIEKFLLRGNRIEIANHGLLKDLGGIVLLKESDPVNILNLTCRSYSKSKSSHPIY